MRTARLLQLLVLGWIGCFGLALPVAGELTKKGAASAYTQHELLADRLSYNRETLAGTYQRLGKMDPKWDGPALGALDALARYFSASGLDAVYRPKDNPTREQLIELGERAVAAGCEDPLVLYVLAVAYDDSQQTAKAIPFIEKAHASARQMEGFPASRLTGMTERAMRRAATPERSSALRADVIGWSMKAANGPFVNQAHRRRVLDDLDSLYPRTNWEEREKLHARLLKEASADPWIVNVYGGRCFRDAAWRARGGGYADTVTPEGWKGFNEHLGKAHECLVKAWELQPELPEAPALMVDIAMGEGGRGEDSPRSWFDRTMKAQIDYEEAWSHLTWSLLPRWGGTHEMIIGVGEEARRTERYDTMVPWQYVAAVKRIAIDGAAGATLHKDPRVFGGVLAVLSRYEEALKDTPEADRLRSIVAAMALKMEKYEEARQVIDRTVKLNTGVFYATSGVVATQGVARVFAMTSGAKKEVMHAMEREARGDFVGALEMYEAALTVLPADDRGRFYVEAGRLMNDWRVRFDRGEWVDILPKEEFHGWYPYAGDARLTEDGRSVELVSAGLRARLGCLVHFGRRFEVEAMVPFPRGALYAGAGVHVDYSTTKSKQSIWLARTGWAYKDVRGERVNQKIKLELTNRIVVRYWDGVAVASVNGQQIKQKAEPTEELPRGGYLELSGYAPETGALARFSGLKVRKLTEEPDGLAEATK